MSENSGVLSLRRLARNSLFRVVQDYNDDEASLSASSIYRLASTMSDSGRTMLVEEAVPLVPGRFAYRWETPIRISRERAKTIAVFKVR